MPPAQKTQHTKTTQTAGKDSAGGVMKCVRAGDQEVLLCSDALMSYASPQTGESVNIYRSETIRRRIPYICSKDSMPPAIPLRWR